MVLQIFFSEMFSGLYIESRSLIDEQMEMLLFKSDLLLHNFILELYEQEIFQNMDNEGISLRFTRLWNIQTSIHLNFLSKEVLNSPQVFLDIFCLIMTNIALITLTSSGYHRGPLYPQPIHVCNPSSHDKL